MDIYEIIAAASIIGGASVAVIRAWARFYERQKQHWNMLQKHTELIEKLYQKMDALPDFNHFVDSAFCREHSQALKAFSTELKTMSERMSEMQRDQRESHREFGEEKLKWGAYMSRVDTLLDERTEKRVWDAR